MRKNVKIPIAAYDPRLKDLLLKGALSRVEVPCRSSHERNALNNQLMNYRARAREEKLEFSTELYRAKMSKPKPKDGIYMLVIAPRGSEFDEVLGGTSVRSAAPPIAHDPLSDIPLEEEKK